MAWLNLNLTRLGNNRRPQNSKNVAFLPPTESNHPYLRGVGYLLVVDRRFPPKNKVSVATRG